ncbi:hypothetical protein MMPV_004808 [Pyropia vietnamensis]
MSPGGTQAPPRSPCRGFTRAWATAAAAATAALGRGRAGALTAATAAVNTAVAAADAPPDAPAVVVVWVHLGAGGGTADRADGLGWLLDGLKQRVRGGCVCGCCGPQRTGGQSAGGWGGRPWRGGGSTVASAAAAAFGTGGGDDTDPREGGDGRGGEPLAHLLVALEDADSFPPEVVRDLIYLAALRNFARRRALAASAAGTAAAAGSGDGAEGRGRRARTAALPAMDAGLLDADGGWGWGEEELPAAGGGADGETGGASPLPPGVTIIAGVGGPAGVRRCVSALGCRERGVMRPAAVGVPPPTAAVAAILRATVIGREAPVIVGPGVVVGLAAHAGGVTELLGALRLVYAVHFWEAPLAGPLSLPHLRCRPPPLSRAAVGDMDTAEAGWAASPLAILDGAPVAPIVSHRAVERVFTAARLATLRTLPSVADALVGAPPGTVADVDHVAAWLTGWSHWRAAAAAAEACVRHVVAAVREEPAAAVAVSLHLAIAKVHLDVSATEAEAADAAAAAAEADSDGDVRVRVASSWVPPAPVVLTPGVLPPDGDAGGDWPDPVDTPTVLALSEVPLIRAASGYIAGMGRVELRQLADAWAAILAAGGDSAEGGWAGESLVPPPGAGVSGGEDPDSGHDSDGDALADVDAEDGSAAWAAAAARASAAGEPGAPLSFPGPAPSLVAGRSTLPPRAPPSTGVLRPLHAAVAAIAEALTDGAIAPAPSAAADPVPGAPAADDVRASLLAGARGAGAGGGGSVAMAGGGSVGAKRRRAAQLNAATTAAASSAVAGTLPARTAAAAALRTLLGCLTDPRRLPLAEVVVADGGGWAAAAGVGGAGPRAAVARGLTADGGPLGMAWRHLLEGGRRVNVADWFTGVVAEGEARAALRGAGGGGGGRGRGGDDADADADPDPDAGADTDVDADGGDGGTAAAVAFVGAAKALQFLGVVRAGGRRGDTVSRLFYPQ